MEKQKLKEGMLLQINPEINHKFGGMIVVVTEPKSWGAQGYLMSYHNFEACRVIASQLAYVRVKYEEIELVGHIEWMACEKTESNEEENQNG